MEKTTTDEILLDGKYYIPAKRAAILTGYTTDYVGQLCRSGELNATRIGRNWYIEENSLIERKSSKLELKNNEDENTKKAIEKKIGRNRNIFKSSFIIYSNDDRALLPELNDKIAQIEQVPIKVVKEGANSTLVSDLISIKKDEKIEKNVKIVISPFSLSQKILSLSIALVAFVVFFSLNTEDNTSFLENDAKNLTGATSNIQFVHTVNEEIFVPFELVAKEINILVDEVVYSLLYGDILHSE